MELAEILGLFAYLVIGITAGFIGGLLGLSGGVVSIPCLVLIFHLIKFPQSYLVHTAIGTSLSAMVLNGISSTSAHSKHKGVDWKIVYKMIPGIFLGCLLGAFVAHFLSGIILEMIFGLFILLLGIYMLWHKKTKKESSLHPSPTFYSLWGLGIGSFSSLLGLGGGVFTVPFLLSIQRSEKKAIGTSAALGLLITFIAAIGYLYFGLEVATAKGSIGYIYLPAFFILSLAAFFSAPFGAKIAHQIEGRKLKKIFGGSLIAIGILMILD